MMKILLVDDDDLIKDGLAILLNLEEDMEVIGLCSNGQEAMNFCKDRTPDVILMDIRMSVMDGVLGVKNIKAMNPQIKVLMLTTFKDDEYIRASMENGADGYILKNQGAVKIIEAIRSVNQGHLVLDHQIRHNIFSSLSKASKQSFDDYGISEREGEILALIGQGHSNKEIAETLFLSLGTVRNYITNLLDKLALRDRTQLALFYVKNIEA
jgi:DNA-binding NarL/FixJ family response regulator